LGGVCHAKSEKKGCYVLFIDVGSPLALAVGSLGRVHIPAGRYAYVGSSRSGALSRVQRHRRLTEQKSGRIHWHIDYLLTHPRVQWAGETVMADGVECEISGKISTAAGVTVPVPGFGSSDCHAGCEAHLYLLPKSFRESDLAGSF
jgi:Uri superfamily endonuclease